MPSPYTSAIISFLTAALINSALAIITWRQRERSEVGPLWMMVLLCVVLWSSASALVLTVQDITWAMTIFRINHIAVVSIIYFWGVFALHYSNHDQWLTPRFHFIFAGISVAAFLIFLFDKSGLFYDVQVFIDPTDGFLKFILNNGPVGLAWAVYGYLVLFISLILIVRRIQRHPHLYRIQSILIVIAVGFPLVANVVQFFDTAPRPIDLTSISFMVTGICMFVATQRFELLRLMPVAYDTIYQNISNGIIIINTQGNIVRMNPAAESILGVEQKTTIGAPISRYFPNHHEQIMGTASEQPTNVEIQLGTASRSYELQVNTLNWSRRLGYAIMLFDITERKRALEERSQRLLEEERTQILTTFMQKAAHEFRTPLSIIKSGQYLIGRTTDSEKVKVLAQRSDQQVDAITHLVDNLMLITRIDNPHAELEFQVVDWNRFIQPIIDRQRPVAAGRGITLVYEADTTKPQVKIDEDLMASAVHELLDNAIRYSVDGGQVTIACTAPQCTVKFIDCGHGIPESEQVRIFERFYRVDESHNTRGFGLGLPIAQTIAERHNGSVKLEASSDKGSVFVLWLPVST